MSWLRVLNSLGVTMNGYDAAVPIALVPPGLLQLLAPVSLLQPSGVKPGRFTPEELVKLLSYLDPCDFQDHDKWFQLKCSSHYATGGEGCEEFVEWSTGDPRYSGDGDKIRYRWGTLGNNTERGTVVTERTLLRYVREAGGTIPGESPETDFDALPDLAIDKLGSNPNENERESEESLIEVVERLAKLSFLEYDQQRKAEAEALGVTLKNLDKSVAQARAKNGVGQDAQGAEIVFPDILLADAPVDGRALLNNLTNVLNRYLVLPTGAAEAIVLWVMRSFAHDVFEINPRLAARSPEKQCGKTTLLEFLTMIVPRPLLSSNCTPASIFRIIEKCQPTLLVDEMDSFQDSHEELRGILNSGHTRAAARVIRTVGEDHEPRAFSTWCPMVLAAIGKLPDTLEDRSLRINLQRKKKSDTVQRFPRKGPALKALQEELNILQGQCARWVADHMTALSVAEPEALPELSDRANDNWYSLLSVAEVVGGEWPQKARLTAVTLSGEDTDAKTLGVQLLADIQEIFETKKVDRISSQELCLALEKLEERPWATWPKGKPITMNRLAWLLGKFGATSQSIRFGYKDVAKGYLKENFVEPWERYGVLPSTNEDSNSYGVTTAMNKGQNLDLDKVTEESCNLFD